MKQVEWGKKLFAFLLSFAMICTVIPETFYAAALTEEDVKKESVITEGKAEKEAGESRGAEAVDSTGWLDWDDISVANAVEIQEDRIQNVNIAEEEGYQVYKFIPEETKTYTFFSTGYFATHGMIKSADGSQIEEYDDEIDYEKDENFSIKAKLTAGKVYYCAAQMFYSDEIGSFLCMISSTRSEFFLESADIKKFEITHCDKTEFYECQNNIDDLDVGYNYRITCMDDQIIEGYNKYRWKLYGAYVSVRFKNEIEEGVADTSSGSNALIYNLGGVDAEEIPITFVPSPVASMEVLESPWTTVLQRSQYDLANDMTGLRIQINYTNGDSAIAVGDGEEWYIEEDFDWVYPEYRWKFYDEGENLALGSNAIIFSYLGVEVEVPVTVESNSVQSISIMKNPEKMFYDIYDYRVDLFGLNLKIIYLDGFSEVVTVTKHSRDVRIGKYSLELSGFFEYDDDDEKTGLISLLYGGEETFYQATIQTYASLIKNAAAIRPEQSVSISLDENNKYRVFRFVPSETREYKISSAGTCDTYVELLDANGNYLSDDDEGGTDNNFALTTRLEAGKTYYYLVRLYDVGEVGTFTCTLSGGGVSYTITYNLNGGTNQTSNPAVFNSEAVVLKNPVRSQYIFEGWYTDSAYKNKITQIPAGAKQNYVLYAKWQKVQAPGKAKLTAASNSKSKKIAVKYKKVKNVDGYEISYAMNKKFKKASSITASKTKATISKLKKGKTYYVRVCAYNLDSTGQKVRGKWSSAKKVTVKK